MKKEYIEKYLNQFVIVGIPHSFRENAMFYHVGTLIDTNDEGIILSHGDEEIFLTYDMIKQLRASPSGALHDGRK